MTNLCMPRITCYAFSQHSNKFKQVKKLLHRENSFHKDVCKSILIQMDLFKETWEVPREMSVFYFFPQRILWISSVAHQLHSSCSFSLSYV